MDRRYAGTILMLRGLLLSGVMDYREAVHFGKRTSGNARLLLRHACFREDAGLLQHATSNLLGRQVVDVPPEEYDAQCAGLLLRALNGRGKVADFDRLAEEHPPVAASSAMRVLMLALHGGQHARLLKDRNRLCTQVKEAHRAFENLPLELAPRIEFKVLHFRNLAALGKAGPWRERAVELHSELRQQIEIGYTGLKPLPALS